MSALSHLRILELAGSVAGEHCGKLLADFGAEIIKIESPGDGSATRHIGPFSQTAAVPRDKQVDGPDQYRCDRQKQ